MGDFLVLVDLANTSIFRGLKRPNPAIVASRLDGYLIPLTDLIHAAAGEDVTSLKVRLYDGWFDDHGRGSDLYSLVRSHVRDAYPTKKKRYRLFVEVADSLLADESERLLNTFRILRGLGRSQITVSDAPPATCIRPGTCAIHELRRWTKGTCPIDQCTAKTADAACFKQQKLVDTSIIADAVWAASNKIPFAIVSDDEDVIPGLIAGRALGSRVIWASQAARPREPYFRLIAKHTIEYISC